MSKRENPNNHETRWVSKKGITGKVPTIASRLTPELDEIIRSLSEDDLFKLCGEKTLAGYMRVAIVRQMKHDGLISPDYALEQVPEEPKSRKRKKGNEAIAQPSVDAED